MSAKVINADLGGVRTGRGDDVLFHVAFGIASMINLA
jgi:hypothetical protein